MPSPPIRPDPVRPDPSQPAADRPPHRAATPDRPPATAKADARPAAGTAPPASSALPVPAVRVATQPGTGDGAGSAGTGAGTSAEAGRVDAVRAVGLVKVYGAGAAAVTALDRVTVGFEAGRFTAIMGPSGSGKSTLLHCLAGIDSVDAGQVLVGGTDLTALGDKGRTRLRRDAIGLVFQAFNLLPTLTARDNVELPLRIAGRRPDRAWIDEVTGALGLDGRLHHRPAELSGGEQQRVAVARALAPKPVVVLADEPTGNLDSRAGGELLGFLRRSVTRLGQTIVLVTHDPVAAAHADRVLFLADGRMAGTLDSPTVGTVLDRLKALERPAPAVAVGRDGDGRG
jgi:putative ABC transport system ATP-binding protein